MLTQTTKCGFLYAVAASLLLLAGCACGRPCQKNAGAAAPPPPSTPAPDKTTSDWESLFDGESLGDWKITDFGGQGEVKVEGGKLILPMGNNMTGVTWAGEIAKIDYEIELDAMRVTGSDFFCALTFPVVGSSASLVLGGWGGSVCGISSLDGYDASDNSTTTIREFKNGQWYHVRARVTQKRIQAWLDTDQIVDVNITGKKVDVRIEVELCKPLGIATWQTTGAIRNIRVRSLTPDEVKASEPKEE
jgi:hypothetical protein